MLAIKFLNDTTGNLKKANYKYEVVVTQTVKGKLEVIKIAEGEVRGHIRDSGWEGLIKKFSDQIQKEKNNDLMNIITQLEEETKC